MTVSLVGRSLFGLAIAIGAGAMMATSAQASLIYPTSATGSSSFGGYPDLDAIDTGANKFITDWASGSQGAGSFLNLSFAAPETFTSVFLTDRTTSGAGNGGFVGGLFDYTTRASLQAYNSTFTTPIGAAVIFSKPVPGSTSSFTDFQFTQALSGLSGQYLRYTVLATNGVNPGLADIEFGVTTVPEPMSLSVLGVGLLGLGFVRHRKHG
jgi:hypothetical protein